MNILLASQQKRTVPAPPANTNKELPSPSVVLNPEHVMRFTALTSQNNSQPPPPVPPQRDAPRTFTGSKVGLPQPSPLSEVVNNVSSGNRNNESHTAALDYDHDFEKRFSFMSIENLPPPEPWQPLSLEARSDRSFTTA